MTRTPYIRRAEASHTDATHTDAKRARARPQRRRLPLSRRIPIASRAPLALPCLPALARVAADQDAVAAEIVAAQIRTQGYACAEPVAAERDRAASVPNETVWVLSCGNARYRVRL